MMAVCVTLIWWKKSLRWVMTSERDTKICLSLLLCSSCHFGLLRGMSVSISNLVQFTHLTVKGDSDQMMFWAVLMLCPLQVTKFKSMRADLEEVARQKATLAKEHKWSDIENLPKLTSLFSKHGVPFLTPIWTWKSIHLESCPSLAQHTCASKSSRAWTSSSPNIAPAYSPVWRSKSHLTALTYGRSAASHFFRKNIYFRPKADVVFFVCSSASIHCWLRKKTEEDESGLVTNRQNVMLTVLKLQLIVVFILKWASFYVTQIWEGLK